MYKIGDLVRIKPRTGGKDDYKFCYADEMTNLEGTICKIVDISASEYDDCEIPDDGNEYELEFAYESDKDKFEYGPFGYKWASSMFEKYEGSMQETKQTKTTMKYKVGDIVRIKHREGEASDYKYTFSDYMTELEGKICRIKSIEEGYSHSVNRYKDDDAKYKLEFYDKDEYGKTGHEPDDYSWASSMFERFNGYVSILTRGTKEKHTYKLNFKI